MCFCFCFWFCFFVFGGGWGGTGFLLVFSICCVGGGHAVNPAKPSVVLDTACLPVGQEDPQIVCQWARKTLKLSASRPGRPSSCLPVGQEDPPVVCQ